MLYTIQEPRNLHAVERLPLLACAGMMAAARRDVTGTSCSPATLHQLLLHNQVVYINLTSDLLASRVVESKHVCISQTCAWHHATGSWEHPCFRLCAVQGMKIAVLSVAFLLSVVLGNVALKFIPVSFSQV